MQIEISVMLDEKDVADLAAEHESNESSFVHDFSRRILEAAARSTRIMKETARAIDNANPFGNLSAEQPTEKEDMEI